MPQPDRPAARTARAALMFLTLALLALAAPAFLGVGPGGAGGAPAPRERKDLPPARPGDGSSARSPLWPEYLQLASLKEVNVRSGEDRYRDKTIYLFGPVVKVLIRDNICYVHTGEVGVPVSKRWLVTCVFDPEHAGALRALPEGGYVTVRGRCHGWRDGWAELVNCVVVAAHARSPWGETWRYESRDE